MFGFNDDKKLVRREFIKIDSISKHLYCTICDEVFNDPVRIICGYLYEY